MVELSLCSISRASHPILLYHCSVLDRLLLVKAIGHSAALYGTLSCQQFMPSLTCNNPALRLTPDVSVFRYRGADMSYSSIYAPFLTIFFTLSYRSCYILFHDQSAFTDVSFHRGSHNCAIMAANYLGNLVYLGMTAALFWILVVACL